MTTASIDTRICQVCVSCPPMNSCPSTAIERIELEEPPFVNTSYCHACGECMKKCPHKAIKIIGA